MVFTCKHLVGRLYTPSARKPWLTVYRACPSYTQMTRRAGLRSPSLHIISNWDAAGISTGHLHKIHLQLFVVDMHNVNYFPGGATIPVATVQYFHAFPSSWRTRWRAIFVTRPCKYCGTRVAPHFSSSYRHGFSKPNRRSHFVLRFPLFLVAS